MSLALAVLSCLVHCGEAEAAQDQAHYRLAMTGRSSSPYFVLVTIKDDTTGSAFTGCVVANFLKGAIYRELGGEWDASADDEKRKAELALLQKADEIALNSINHEFHFSKPAALANIPAHYTEDELAEARNIVQSAGVETFVSPPITTDKRSMKRPQWNAALACAIIEKGASARQADITGQIYAEP